MNLLEVMERLSEAAEGVVVPNDLWVYNPLRHAQTSHNLYLERWGEGKKEVLLVGMNPGPWGMVQTGVPFGSVGMVRDFLGIEEEVFRPEREHPKRPVLGFSCPREEVSGARLWGWVRERWGRPKPFFERFFVHNLCPLAFMEESGKNLTPNLLPSPSREEIAHVCQTALREVVAVLSPEWVVGIGVWAERQAQIALNGLDINIGRILHPSPASPVANRGWAPQAEARLDALGIQIP
ncbi:single-stranded DNA-binding protein [bacterium]|nr:single-stranded DNA-binding protein [bacterium]